MNVSSTSSTSAAGSAAATMAAVLSSGSKDAATTGSVADTTAAILGSGSSSASSAGVQGASSITRTSTTEAVVKAGRHDEANEVEGDDDRDEGGERSHVSEQGRAYSQLHDLASADPAGFKAMASDVSDRLRATAGAASGDQGSLLLAAADQFAKAAQTGQLDALGLKSQNFFQGHSGVRKYAEQQAASPKARQVKDLIQELLGHASAAR